MLIKVANKDTNSVISALIKQAGRLLKELYKTLTWDRGKELADHPRLTMATNVEVNFVIPSHLGSAAQTKIPTVYCDSIYRVEQVCRCIHKPN